MKSKTYNFSCDCYFDLEHIVREHINRTDNPHSISAADIGLGNVDNTSDIDKPVSSATKNYVDKLTICQIKMVRTDQTETHLTGQDEEKYNIGEVKVSLLNNKFEEVSSDFFLVDNVAHDFQGREFVSEYAGSLDFEQDGTLTLLSPDGTILSKAVIPAGLTSVSVRADDKRVALIMQLSDGNRIDCSLDTLITYLYTLFVNKEEFKEYKDLIDLRLVRDEEQVNALANELHENVTRVENEINKLRIDSGNALERAVQDLQTKLDNAKLTITTKHEVDVNNLTTKINTINNDLSAEDVRLDNKIDALDAAVENRIDLLKDGVDQRLDSIQDNFENRLDVVKNELNSKLDTTKENLQETIELDIQNLENKLDNNTDVITSIIDQNNLNYQAKFNEINRDIDSVKNDLNNEVNTINNTIISKVNELNNNIDLKVAELDSDIQNESVLLQKEIDAAAHILEVLNDDVAYSYTFYLRDKKGNIINQHTIDLPVESFVIDANYISEKKEIELQLKNGNKISFSVSDLVYGLASNDDLNNLNINLNSKINNLEADLLNEIETKRDENLHKILDEEVARKAKDNELELQISNINTKLPSFITEENLDVKLVDYVKSSELDSKINNFVQDNDLAKVAKSGDYNDLINLPDLSNIEGIGGKVDDVVVNGISIVSDKIATINFKTINGQVITGAGNIEVATESTDLTEVNNLIAQLTARIVELENRVTELENDSIVTNPTYDVSQEEGLTEAIDNMATDEEVNSDGSAEVVSLDPEGSEQLINNVLNN